MSEQYEDQNHDSSGQDQTDGGGGEGGGEENNEADMIFAPEASKPGRNAGMLMIAFVMIGVGVIYFMRVRAGGPGIIRPDVAQADSRIKDFIKDGSQVKKMKDLLENTEKVVKIMNEDPTKNAPQQVIDKKNNPFTYHSPNEKPNETEDEKAIRLRNKTREARVAAFKEDIKLIRVQSVIINSFAKTAMINNKLVQEGQEIEGFTIVKLAPNSVIVERDGMKAEISLNKEMK